MEAVPYVEAAACLLLATPPSESDPFFSFSMSVSSAWTYKSLYLRLCPSLYHSLFATNSLLMVSLNASLLNFQENNLIGPALSYFGQCLCTRWYQRFLSCQPINWCLKDGLSRDPHDMVYCSFSMDYGQERQ